MVQFRVIYVTSAGSIEVRPTDSLHAAYRSCINNNPTDWHVKVFLEVERELARSEGAVRVAYNEPSDAPMNGGFAPPRTRNNYLYEAYYIQKLDATVTTPSIYVQFPTNIVVPGPLPC